MSHSIQSRIQLAAENCMHKIASASDFGHSDTYLLANRLEQHIKQEKYAASINVDAALQLAPIGAAAGGIGGAALDLIQNSEEPFSIGRLLKKTLIGMGIGTAAAVPASMAFDPGNTPASILQDVERSAKHLYSNAEKGYKRFSDVISMTDGLSAIKNSNMSDREKQEAYAKIIKENTGLEVGGLMAANNMANAFTGKQTSDVPAKDKGIANVVVDEVNKAVGAKGKDSDTAIGDFGAMLFSLLPQEKKETQK